MENLNNYESKNNNPWLYEWKKEISWTKGNTANKTLNIINSKENFYEWMTKIQIKIHGAKIGVTWTQVSEILGHQYHFYLDTKIGSHLDTFLVTPMKKINLS